MSNVKGAAVKPSQALNLGKYPRQFSIGVQQNNGKRNNNKLK